jgi:hypothetical protein
MEKFAQFLLHYPMGSPLPKLMAALSVYLHNSPFGWRSPWPVLFTALGGDWLHAPFTSQIAIFVVDYQGGVRGICSVRMACW